MSASDAEEPGSGSMPTIRPTSADDLQAVDAFIEPFVEQKRILPRTIDELRDLLPHAFLAEMDGKVVGFAALEIYSRKLAEIRSLAVDDSQRGKGIGRALVDACLERARDRNVFEVMVVTSEDAFFERCGFHYTLPGEKRALFHQTRDEH